MVIMQINRFLIRIDETMKRSFYEIECVNNNWSRYKLSLPTEEELKAEIQIESYA